MVPLAATSFNRAIRAMGPKRWKQLHRTVYAVALLGLLHFFWMRAAKHNFAEWSVYAGVLAVLLGWRLRGLRGALSKAAPPGRGEGKAAARP
jgi:sulfoxide reductase heme-binding subunit YedZ